MLLEKFSTEVIDNFLAGINQNGRLEKIKSQLIDPSLMHVSKYFNKYIMYFYTILILLIVFIILLIILMMKMMSKLTEINGIVLTQMSK